MSQTLGERIRQAREARGISISEVAEQTRISALYLESIENDDYRPLPGGIFNKGFVKSYAKFVGIDEQEALRDYSNLMAQQGETNPEETKTFRSEVLTDDNARSTSIPTIIFAVIILGLLAGGVFSLVNYWNNPGPITTNSNSANSNRAIDNSNTANSNVNTAASPIPADEIKAEFRALSSNISVSYIEDGKTTNKTVPANGSVSMTAKESLKISYYKGFTPDKIQFTLNGKQINAPAPPARGNIISFEINKGNIAQILQSGALVTGESAPSSANATRR